MNNGEVCSKTSLDDLNDELLLEILCRLPDYKAALRCKTVSRRWRSIISDPFFVTQGLSTHRKINQKKQSWTLLLTMSMRNDNVVMSTIAPPYCQPMVAMSSYLKLPCRPPYDFNFVQTFGDLILCFGVNTLTKVGVFFLCNPLTKQSIALPPSPTHEKTLLWAGLVCQEGRGFRVVVIHPSPRMMFCDEHTFKKLNMVIYLSETEEWKSIDFGLPIRRCSEGHASAPLSGAVCKGMVYLRHLTYFGVFNPFDVTRNFRGTLNAIGSVPLPKVGGKLHESCGKLVAVNNYIPLVFSSDRKSIRCALRWVIWKLDIEPMKDEQPLRWEQVSVLYGDIRVKGSILPACDDVGINYNYKYKVVGVHPDKEHLIYLIIPVTNGEKQLCLCNTRSNILKPLRIMPALECLAFNKLDLPCWPRPIPKSINDKHR